MGKAWIRGSMLALVAASGVAAAVLWLPRGDDYPSRGIDVHPSIDAEEWALYAVEYARSDGIPLDRLVRGAADGETTAMSWTLFVAVGHGRIVLVDAGTDRFAAKPDGKTARRWSIQRSRTVPEALAALGLHPDEVTDVLITHRHWDHVEGLRHFDAATVHVHAGEWEALDGAGFGGEVATFSTPTATPLPQVTLMEAGRHTPHHCVVEFECGGSPLVVAGDGAYLFHNLDHGVPIAVTRSETGNVNDMAEIVDRVGEGRVIPGHDPEVYVRFDSPREGIAAICPQARLTPTSHRRRFPGVPLARPTRSPGPAPPRPAAPPLRGCR